MYVFPVVSLFFGEAFPKVPVYPWRVDPYPIAPYTSMVHLYLAAAVEGCGSTVDPYVDIYPATVAPYP